MIYYGLEFRFCLYQDRIVFYQPQFLMKQWIFIWYFKFLNLKI